MPSIKLNCPIDLDYTLNSGQVFRWKYVDGCWYGIVNHNVIKLKKSSNILEYDSHEKITNSFFFNYFRLNDPYDEILSSFSKDSFISQVISKRYGLYLISQDPWECLISFLCATNTNIPRIKRMIENLCKKFGTEIIFENKSFFSFPDMHSLSSADLNDLQQCNLGYRAKYIKNAALFLSERPSFFKNLFSMNYETAHKCLASNKSSEHMLGIGNKVADCILLFSFNKMESFPIDTRIFSTICDNYLELFDSDFSMKLLKNKSNQTQLSNSQYELVKNTMSTYFGPYSGYAQQFLYYRDS